MSRVYKCDRCGRVIQMSPAKIATPGQEGPGAGSSRLSKPTTNIQALGQSGSQRERYISWGHMCSDCRGEFLDWWETTEEE